MTERLTILENSLIKKQSILDDKFSCHFADVKRANGQPLNDKRNGQSTLNRWEKQNLGINKAREEIEKTKNAIEHEKGLILDCEKVKSSIPKAILNALEEGLITQWRKHPNNFFVVDGGKARFKWVKNKLTFSHASQCNTEEFKQFKTILININNEIIKDKNNV